MAFRPRTLRTVAGSSKHSSLGVRIRWSHIDEGDIAEFPDAAIDARLSGFEAGLRTARMALETGHSDSVLDILNDGRVTFTPEQRADPRYHALFRHPKLVRIAAARRKEGVLSGLPVFPVKPYTGR